MANMGVREWAKSWLAFNRLMQNRRIGLDLGTKFWKNIQELGWYKDIGLFGSIDKRLRERVSASPYDFKVACACGLGADIYVSRPGHLGMEPGSWTPPEKLVGKLAEQEGVSEDTLFSAKEVNRAIAIFNLDMGLLAVSKADFSVGARRLTLAADLGNGRAQLGLGRLYSDGKGVPQDHLLAHKWLNLAAATLGGDDRAEAVKLRDKQFKGLTPDGRTQAEAMARQWSLKEWDELTRFDPTADTAD
jgi:hypothetical protein